MVRLRVGSASPFGSSMNVGLPARYVRQVGTGRRLRRVAVAAGVDRVDQVLAARLLGGQDDPASRSTGSAPRCSQRWPLRRRSRPLRPLRRQPAADAADAALRIGVAAAADGPAAETRDSQAHSHDQSVLVGTHA